MRVKIWNLFWEVWKNIVGKEENAGYQHFLHSPQYFQKAFFSRLIEIGIVSYRVKTFCRWSICCACQRKILHHDWVICLAKWIVWVFDHVMCISVFTALWRYINCLPSDKIIDYSKLEAFADNINVTQILKSVLGRIENIVGKGENDDYHSVLKRLFIQGI